MSKADYHARKEARIARLRQAAERAERESASTFKSARNLADVIPLGQPILVGHHSEKRHRRHLARIDSKYSKAAELHKKAEYLKRIAASAEDNRAISSDDPEAVRLIREKIEKIEAEKEQGKRVNALLRKGDDEGLRALGLSDKTITRLKEPEFGGVGFESYWFANRNSEIRRLKQRITQLQAESARPTVEKKISTQAGTVEIIDNADDNRIQMFFPGKPAPQIIQALKSAGFRWAPSVGCWQAYRNNRARYEAERILQLITGEPAPERSL